MAHVSNRIPFSVQNPYRPVRPATDKIIFLSLEGAVTEHEYFERVSELFDQVKNKIQFIPVTEDEFYTEEEIRTPEQKKILSSVRPLQLVKRIDEFKQTNDYKYEFGKYPDDEFWIVTDVDDNWSDERISEWNEATKQCNDKNYQYAVSNPFFEIWLLLHYDNPTDEDKAFAVTSQNDYQPTNHFRMRLRELKVPLYKEKHIRRENFSSENIRVATSRARSLHIDKTDLSPHYFSTTVYLLLDKIISLVGES